MKRKPDPRLGGKDGRFVKRARVDEDNHHGTSASEIPASSLAVTGTVDSNTQPNQASGQLDTSLSLAHPSRQSNLKNERQDVIHDLLVPTLSITTRKTRPKTNFMSLPLELRRMIYGHCLIQATPIRINRIRRYKPVFKDERNEEYWW